jgi:hypothetical protein
MTVNDNLGTQATGTFSITLSEGDSSTNPPTPCGAVALYQLWSPLPDAVNSKPYAAQLAVVGGTYPFTWSVASGNLALSGLVLDQARGVVRGTPFASAAGQTFTFTIDVTDSSTPQQDAPAYYGEPAFSITVH